MSVFGMLLAVALVRLFFGKRLPAWPRHVYIKSMGSLGLFDFLSSHYHGKPDKIPLQNYFPLGKNPILRCENVRFREGRHHLWHPAFFSTWSLKDCGASKKSRIPTVKTHAQCQLTTGVTPKGVWSFCFQKVCCSGALNIFQCFGIFLWKISGG